MSSSSPTPPLLSPRPRPWASTSRAIDSQGTTDSPQTVERMLGGVEGSVWEGDWSGEEGSEQSEREGSPRPTRINEEEDHGTRAWSESPPPLPPSANGQNQQQQQQQHQHHPSSSSNPLEPHLDHPGLLLPSSFAPSPPQTPDQLRAHQQQQQPYASTPSPPSSASGILREREEDDPTSPNSAAAQQLLETLARMSHDPSAIDTSPITGDIPSAGLRRVRGPTMTTLEERTEEGSSQGGGNAYEQHERMRSLDEEEGSVGSRRSRIIEARLGTLPPSTQNSTLPPILRSTLSSILEPLPSQVALPASRPSSGVFPTSTSLPFLSASPSSYPLPTSLSASNLSSTRPTSSPLPHPPPNTSSSLPPPSRSTGDLIAMFERQKQGLLTPGGSTSTSTSPVRTSYLSALPSSPSRSKSPTRKSAFDLSQFGTAAATLSQSTFRPVLSPFKDRSLTKIEREDTFSDDTTTTAEEGLMPIPLAPLPPPRTPPPFSSTRLPAPSTSPIEPPLPPTPRARQSPLQKVVSAFTSGGSRPGGGGGWEAASFGRRTGASWASTTGGGGSGSGGLSIIKRAREGLRGRSRDRKAAEVEAARGVAVAAGGGGRSAEEVREMRDETSVHTGTVRVRGSPSRVAGSGDEEDTKGEERDDGDETSGEREDDEEMEIEQ
ncbi:hypothetical protein BDY24DRAFT_443645, partial [Mrakia frigida]|uniref:uncharacterized protein n=1 Tax=Mrakia frigida TaxID=29902 RepID=UPI003FCC18B5